MHDFVKYVLPYNSRYITYNLSRADESKIISKTIESLGLTDLNQLRDRYEGIAFLENTMKRVVPLLILSKLLNIELISLRALQPKKLTQSISINQLEFEIKVFDYGTIPKFKILNTLPQLLFMKRDRFSYLFCGIASTKLLNKETEMKFDGNRITGKEIIPFFDFGALETIEFFLLNETN